jgi:hypothetical protein
MKDAVYKYLLRHQSLLADIRNQNKFSCDFETLTEENLIVTESKDVISDVYL